MTNVKDFFVSYTKADEEWAAWIAHQLEAAGYSTFVQAWNFVPGQNFVLQMRQALAHCEGTIVVLTRNYIESGFSQAEWTMAFAKDPTGEKRLLLPVRTDDVEPPGLLKAIAYIDLLGVNDEAEARERLLEGVTGTRAKPHAAPRFPGVAKLATPAPTFPGALPSIWNAPRRNPHFIDREETLHGLRANLKAGGVLAIVGLAGIGKTQLAIEYAHRFKDSYRAVWWVRAEEPVGCIRVC